MEMYLSRSYFEPDRKRKIFIYSVAFFFVRDKFWLEFVGYISCLVPLFNGFVAAH